MVAPFYLGKNITTSSDLTLDDGFYREIIPFYMALNQVSELLECTSIYPDYVLRIPCLGAGFMLVLLDELGR